MSVIFWNTQRGHRSREAGGARFTPLADIAETAAGYVIELELPGFSASDVDVQIRDGVLSVAGERPAGHPQVAQIEHQEAQAEAEPAAERSEARRVHLAERAFGRFNRQFRLPKDADAGAVSATARDGVLTLEIARLAEAAPRNIEVKVA